MIRPELEKLFSNPAGISQQFDLYGYKNGINEIQIYLAGTEEEWKGICFFPSSNDKINLEGGIVNNKLVLNELSDDGQTIGMWQIDLNHKPVKGMWRNNDGSKDFVLELKELNKLNKTLEIRNDEVDIYDAHFINQDYQLISTRNSGKIKKVSIINLSKSTIKNSHITCLSDRCNTFEIKFDNPNSLNKLLCKKNNNDLDLIIWDNKRTKFKGKAILKNSIKLQNKSYINKDFSLNIKYPFVSTNNFNEIINNVVEDTFDSLKSEMEHLFQTSEDINDRQKIEANAWFEIDYYSDFVFSGRFFIQKSYSEKTQIIPINYSLQSGKKINIFKQFSQDFNLNFFISQYLKENIKQLPEYKLALYRNFLKPSSFKYLTLTRAGLMISTEFNSILGSYKIIIPFAEIKDDIKRRSILKKILKS